MKKLFLLFNHTITEAQEKDARTSLGVDTIINLPQHLENTWNQIPADLSAISGHLAPVKNWLADQSARGDHVLIQGDFGACYLMVNFAFQNNLLPVYSTTRRQAEENHEPDGSVKLTHKFKHIDFRHYGV